MKYVPKRLERTADISRGQSSVWGTIVDLAQLALVLLAIYLALGLVADLAAENIPSSWEARFSWAPDLSDSDDGLARAEAVLDRLLNGADLRALPYRVVVADHELPNAFAFPGGTIAVTSGLLDSIESDIGLAMVIGHELGHHQRRHVLKRLGRVFLVVIPVLAFSGDAGSWIDDLLNVGEGKYSRDQEREADEVGLELVFAAYGDTRGALEFFELIASEEEDAGQWSGLAASHPPTAERIEALQRKARLLRLSQE